MKRKAPKQQKKKKAERPNPATLPAEIPFEQVQALIDLLEERGLEEFELERAGLRVRIRRQSAGGSLAVENAPTSAPAGAGSPPPTSSPSASGSQPVPPAAEPPVEEDVHLVKSPIVGTFYAAPSPDAPAFVQVGDQVQAGQVLCIIEAMKLMNEIEADVAGQITRVYVENGQAVEYGEPLFALRPA